MASVNVILNFSKTARYAFNALVGALETYIEPDCINITAARSKQDLPSLLEQTGSVPTLVLWSFYSPQFKRITHELADLKQRVRHSNILHIAGGVHASAEPLQTLQSGFDFVAVGEGEKIIVDFVAALIEGKPPTDVKGIAYLENGQLRRNGRGELIDLNAYPPFAPGHHLFGAIEITRGCIYACKFCQTPYVSKARFRHRSIDQIARYARIMRAQGFRDYRFISPTSLSYGSPDENVNLEAVERLLAATRDAVGPDARIFFGSFPSEVRPEHVSRAALQILKRYVDNDNLIIGGQSGSQNVLDMSKRGHSVQAVIDAVELCLQEGFMPNVDFLFGLPGETETDVQQTLTLANELTDMGARVHNHTFMPLPGTPFKRSDAGNINESAQEAILRLESKGKAYGKWKSQIETARELVQLRDREK